MDKLTGRVRAAVEKYQLIEEGDRIAVGVSGGKDSPVSAVRPGGALSILPQALLGGGCHRRPMFWGCAGELLPDTGVVRFLGRPLYY